jgi:hypothetical protein
MLNSVSRGSYLSAYVVWYAPFSCRAAACHMAVLAGLFYFILFRQRHGGILSQARTEAKNRVILPTSHHEPSMFPE